MDNGCNFHQKSYGITALKASDCDWTTMLKSILPHGNSVLAFNGDTLIGVRTASVETRKKDDKNEEENTDRAFNL